MDEALEISPFEDLLPGDPAFDAAVAQGEYDLARSRFVRTINHKGVERVVEHAAAVRGRLRHDIDNLRTLVRAKHESAVDLARNYGSILPHRVGKTWIQPPSQLERVGAFYGADRLYKLAARAAKEYVEVRDLLIKRREQLIVMESKLRKQLDEREAQLLAELDSPRALQYALLRDPLLNMAYKKLKALQSEIDADAKATDDGLGDL
jgi:hypothetical protein